MKKHKLIKSLLFTPLAIIPLVAAASCGESPISPQDAAANALSNKFNDAKKFVSIVNPAQKAAYSDFVFSTSATDKTKTPTKGYFRDMIKSSKSSTSANKITYTYDSSVVPYLYIFAQEKIQDPDKAKGTMKEMEVLVAEINENFTVSVDKEARANDIGELVLTGYKKGDEINQFKMTTADSQFYITNMLYAVSTFVDGGSGGVTPDYKQIVDKITSSSAPFDAKTNFEMASAATFAFTDDEITYSPTSTGAIFKTGQSPILPNVSYPFEKLEYKFDTKTAILTIKNPAVLAFT